MKLDIAIKTIENLDHPIIIDMGEMAIVDSLAYIGIGLGPCVFHIFPFWDNQKNEIKFMTYHRPPRIYADAEYVDPLKELHSFYELRDEISPGTAIAWVYNSVEGTAGHVYNNAHDKKYNNPLALSKSHCEVWSY